MKQGIHYIEETIKKMEDEIAAMLESQLIQHNWEVRVD